MFHPWLKKLIKKVRISSVYGMGRKKNFFNEDLTENDYKTMESLEWNNFL
jgi:hypothetical protein